MAMAQQMDYQKPKSWPFSVFNNPTFLPPGKSIYDGLSNVFFWFG
jgi:hypothetical protein